MVSYLLWVYLSEGTLKCILIFPLSTEDRAAHTSVIMCWDEWHQSATSEMETNTAAALVSTGLFINGNELTTVTMADQDVLLHYVVVKIDSNVTKINAKF